LSLASGQWATCFHLRWGLRGCRLTAGRASHRVVVSRQPAAREEELAPAPTDR
jgi:hypothetical protein